MKRWPVLVVALGVGGTLLAPDDAGAGVMHDRVATSFGGGGAHALVVQHSRAALTVTPSFGRTRGRPERRDEVAARLDRNDPWTGEPLAPSRISRAAVDMVDPWNGETIDLPESTYAQVDLVNPYGED